MSDVVVASIVSGLFGAFTAILVFVATRKSTSQKIEDAIWERAQETMASMSAEIDKLQASLNNERAKRIELEALVMKLQIELRHERKINQDLKAGRII